MNFDDIAKRVSVLFKRLVAQPLAHFFHGLSPGDRTVLYALLATAVVLGFLIGRRRRLNAWRFFTFLNRGEAQVTRVIFSHFRGPDYHLMNHVTIRTNNGTTQIDHILVSRFGVFVIETKDHKGWIFAGATDKTWTKVLYRLRIRFQSPILQNKRHVRAVQDLLDFLPPEAIRSLVVFTGRAEFKTEIPQGVIMISRLVEYLRDQTEVLMPLDGVQLCVGRLETARLAISGETDVEHVESLKRRLGSRFRDY